MGGTEEGDGLDPDLQGPYYKAFLSTAFIHWSFKHESRQKLGYESPSRSPKLTRIGQSKPCNIHILLLFSYTDIPS